MTGYYLGVDVGGTKTHALIADETGQALGFATGGPGNWEGVGYAGLTRVLLDVTGRALEQAGIQVSQVVGSGMGIGGYDWPSERQDHLDAIRPIGLNCPLEIVNDATLGILAGASEGWGISVVAGTGCNARGWSRVEAATGPGNMQEAMILSPVRCKRWHSSGSSVDPRPLSRVYSWNILEPVTWTIL